MIEFIKVILSTIFRNHSAIIAENIALRHQISVLKRSVKKPKIKKGDRFFWVVLSKLWKGWKKSLYMIREKKPPSQTWKTFLENHMHETVAVDFFVLPTITFRVFFVFIIMRHFDRKLLYFNLTTNPTAQWTANQIVQAFPYDTTPKYLIRDRDSIYGKHFQDRVKNMDINEVIISYRSPWQNPYVERIIGSIRRECLDHIIVLNEKHLRSVLKEYKQYYNSIRPHLSLKRNSPIPRSTESIEEDCDVKSTAILGGLHHFYSRAA